MGFSEDDRHTARLRLDLTDADMVTVQCWLLHRDRTLAHPLGVRRRADRNPHIRRPLKVWRERFGYTRTDLAMSISRCTGGRTIKYETIRALEEGCAQWNVVHDFLPRIADLFGLHTGQIILIATPPKDQP